MKRPNGMHLVLMLVICASAPVLAQDNSFLFDRVEHTIKEKEPHWKLVNKQVPKSGTQAVYEWKSGKSFVGVLMFAHGSSEAATKTYEGLQLGLELVGLKMTILPGELPTVGNDNYVWKDSDHDKIFGVDFRKGKVVVHVSASSMETAKRFACHIADQIPAS